MSKQNQIGLVVFVILALQIFPHFISGQESDLEAECAIDKIEEECGRLSATECRLLLEKCEKYYNEKSLQIQKDITKTEGEKRTLQNKIGALNKKIKDLSYQINQSNILIKDLGLQIGDTELSIEKTARKIGESTEKLAGILRSLYEEDQKGSVEIFLSGDNLSDFFSNVVALDVLSHKNQELLSSIKTLKVGLEEQRTALGSEKDEYERLVKLHTLQQAESKRTKNEQEGLLNLTEQEYQKQIQEKTEIEKQAAQIRARIFELIGVPKAPTFGEAYELAKQVQTLTGVRPAFLLAVLTQESNIGKNVGQCYLKNSVTGAGVVAYNGKEVDRVMKPSRDVQPFLSITEELGRDPYNTPVSCPMSFGWGGAMGPAQFIPSTWNIYRDRIKQIIGKPADPWNIKDAFVGAAVYLADYGGARQNYDDEWKAAMIYFSGSTNAKYGFYGDSVIRITKQYEQDIAALEKAL